MQVVVKENPNSKPNSVSQQNQRKKSNSKMMQIVFEDKERHNDQELRHNDQELRRTDASFFDDYDNDETFRRDSRKTGNHLLPEFPNFPPVTSSEKRATSYTRISFAKPANFDRDTNSN